MNIMSKTTIHDIALYIGRGCNLHPLLYEHYIEQLNSLHRMGKVSFTHHMVFEQYHRRIQKTA